MSGARRDCGDWEKCYCNCWVCQEGHVSDQYGDHCGQHEYGCHRQCIPSVAAR